MQRQHEIAIAVRGLKKSYRNVVRPLLRSREVLIALALILLPVALLFLLVHVAGSTVRTLERRCW